MLAHINPMEAKMLKAMGGKGTPNPTTGLPEYDDNDESYGGESSGSGGSESSGQDEGGYGDLGSGYDTPAGVNEGNFGGGNTEVNDYLSTGRPMGSSKDGGRTTAQIVFDDNYNKMGSFGNLHHELNPQGTEGLGSAFGGGLGTFMADLAQRGTALFPGIGTGISAGIGLLRGQSLQDAAGRSLPMGLGTAYELSEEGKTQAERDASNKNSFSAIGDRFSDKYDQVTDTLKGAVDTVTDTYSAAGRSMTDAWGTLIDAGADAYTGSTGIGPIDRGDSAKDDNAYMGDGSALFGGTAFTPEQNESAFGDSGGSTERKRQMRYIQQRAQAPDATPEEVLRWKQVSNPDYIYTPEAMRTYAERGGPSHFKMVQANTGGGLSDLYNMNEGGTFSGMVKGPDGGDGMSDDVAFDIKDDGQGGPDKALLSKDEYVIDAHSMSLLGNGSSDAGADQMDKFIKDLRKSGFGTTKQPKQLDGAEELSKLL